MVETIQQSELADARKGTLYFLGNINVTRKPSFDVGLVSNFISGTSIVSDLKSASSNILTRSNTGKMLVDGYQKFEKAIGQLVANFFEKLHKAINAIIGADVSLVEWVGEFITWAISSFAASLAEVIPGWGYVQNATDLYDGVKKGVMNALRWLEQVYKGWGVELLKGGPEIIAQGIMQHHAVAVASGMKNMAVASIKIGLQAAGDAAAAAGSIISAVCGFLQRIANLICYAIQRFLLNRTISQAQDHYRNKGELLNDHDQFNHWFQRAVTKTPVVSALMMQSGVVAHPIRFLSLINEHDNVISQLEYDKGVRYIEELKSLSKSYILSFEDCYKLEFSGADDYTQSILSNMRSKS